MGVQEERIDDGIELPAGFRRVHYLESFGEQYINTNYVMQPGDVLSCEVSFISDGATQHFGALQKVSANSWRRIQFGVTNGKLTAYKTPSYSDSVSVGFDKSFHTYQYHDSGVGIDDTFIRSEAAYPAYPILLFARMDNGTVNSFCTARCKSFCVTNNNMEVMRLIPCVRRADNKPGMYDVVTAEFFVNSGDSELFWG